MGEWTVDARAYKLSRDQKRAELENSRATWAVMDAGTMMYLAKGIEMPDESVTAKLPPVPKEEKEEEEGKVELNLPSIPEDLGPIDIDQPIPPMTGPGLSWKRPEPKRERMTTEAARSLFEQRVDAIELDSLESGKTPVVAAREFAALPELAGRTRGWVYNQLERLADDGRLERGNGKTYGIRPRVSA